MNNIQPIQVITKYALILLAFYLIEWMMGYLLPYGSYSEGSNLNLSLHTLIFYGLNIVLALIIYRDRQSMQIKGKYAEVVTIVYRPLGVVIFLLYLLYDQIENRKESKTSS